MRTLPILFLCGCLFSCSTPSELLEKGKVERAFNLASKKLNSKKNVDVNSLVLIEASKKIIQDQLYYNQPLIQSRNIEHWVLAQNNYYKILEDIVVANDLVDGKLQNSYDHLCTEKIELDFKITDHFYQNGEDLLATHYDQLSKHHAREAYYQYQECQSYGGDRFFNNIIDKMDECVYEGRIYFVSLDFFPSTNLFFQPLPEDAYYEPDCVISASFGSPSFSTSTRSVSETFTKEIKVSTKTETDTAGVVRFIPIYETVSATVTTTTVSATASSWTNIYVDNISGYCYKNGNSFNTCVSDSYEEISITGDTRAINSCISTSRGKPAFFRSSLESDLQDEIDNSLFFW